MSTVSTDSNATVEPSQAERVLSALLLRISRVVLQHLQRDPNNDNPAALYWALHEYFACAKARQARAAHLRLRRGEIEAIFRFCLERLAEAELGLDNPNGNKNTHGKKNTNGKKDRNDIKSRNTKKDTNEGNATQRVEAFIRRVPLVSLTKLREGLQKLVRPLPLKEEAVGPLLGPAMAEIVELSRLLDEGLGLPRAPLGGIHLIHLAAVAATLVPTETLGELVRVVAETAEAARVTPAPSETSLIYHFVAAIYHEWGVLDPQHLDGFRALSCRCLDTLSSRASHLQALSLVDLVRMPVSVDEEKLMASAVDPIVVPEHFAKLPREDLKNSSNTIDIEDKEKTPRATPQVVDTIVMSSNETLNTLQNEESSEDGIDYRFWIDLAS
ncbi:unnamed protein product [Phytomonas sp. Hart1]|nr:unnamed protein product [Phytomonas sp. Hart1]|eukprot:CCW68264.1 unnamed protein product [Phytomonas sp. isolate Hart1]